MVDLNIQLLPAQRVVMEHPARFKVLCCGRRWGKSRAAAYIIIISALSKPDQTFFLVSPTYPQTKIIWRMLKKYMPREAIKRIMEGELYIELKNGSLIFAKSGDNPASLRGEGLDGCVIDEAAFVKPDVWNEAIRPALSDKGGWCLLIGTPFGRNWFYEVFLRGMDDNQTEYKSFHYPSFANPLLAKSEIDEMARSMPDLKFRQEILAEFVDTGGLVFRGLEKVLDARPEEAIPGEFYIIGVDLGRHEDFTVIKVGKFSERREVYSERFNKTSWDYIKERIRQVYAQYGGVIIMDSTGYGDPIFEDLSKERLNIRGVNMNVSTKPMLIENLQLMIENQMIHLIDDNDMRVEFGAYTYTVLPSGNVRYEAPVGFHDDIVVATSLMAHGLYGGGSSGMIGAVDPDPHELESDYDSMPSYIDWEAEEEE